jgi:hypothetical protein
MKKILNKGDKVQLWPKDTYAKFAVVREITMHSVTFEITWVEPGEKHYQVGDLITLPRSQIILSSIANLRKI